MDSRFQSVLSIVSEATTRKRRASMAAGMRSMFDGLPCSTSLVVRTAKTMRTDMAPT